MGYSCTKDLLKPSQPSPPNPCIGNGNDDQNHNITGTREVSDRQKNSTTGSSRWNPTPEQLLALEELYRLGTRTPTTEQIQHIASKLRMFGKIEGKNVFYWFQNHKARERQKRRRHHGESNVVDQHMQRNTAVEDLHSHHKHLSSVSRRTGSRRVLDGQTNSLLSSSLSQELIQENENGTAEECKRISENEQHATWQNPMSPRCVSVLDNPSSTSRYYNLITSPAVTPEAEPENVNLYRIDEEESRETRTLELFPVKQNREKPVGTGRIIPNQVCFYEFLPLKN